MNVIHHIFSNFIISVSCSIPRISSAFIFSGFMSKNIVSGFIRSTIIISISIFNYPIIEPQLPKNMDAILWLFILIKEVFIGIILGLLVSIGIWIYEIMGTLIDNHRGATFATVVNPINNNESSILGMFMLQLIVIIFFTGGFFLNFLKVIYNSFLAWPIFNFYPKLNAQFSYECIHILSYIFTMSVTLAAPVILIMFISEMGLVFVNRFAPHLQVFFLAMSIKSGVAFFVLSIYYWLLIEQSHNILNYYHSIIPKLHYYFVM